VTTLVKVTIKPWEEVIIHESIYYSLEDIVKLFSLGVQPGGLTQPLNWAEGVVFHHQAMPPADEVVKEQMQGRVHWLVIQWALMPQYQNFIPIKDINAKIPIVNLSANAILSEVARTLKESKTQA
jgi:hypothetical protein